RPTTAHRTDATANLIKPGQLPFRSTDTHNKTELKRIEADAESDRDILGRGLGREGRKHAGCDDHSYPMLHQVGRQRGQSIVLVPRPAELNCDVPVLHITTLVQTAS